MAISELEPSPNPFDGDFDEVADNFLGVGLPRLRVEINATEVHMEELEASAVAAAAAAAGAVGTVADAAAAAANAASLADTRATAAQAAKVAAETARDLAQTYGAALSGTSTSNLTITKVSKVFATQAGKAWTLGQRLRAASDDGTKVMEGAVTAYAGTNLTVLVDYTKGTGSHADWNISVGGEQGGEGPPGSGTGTVNSVNNHEPDEDGAVVIPDATTTEAGLQSAADKVKLDSIAAGASANDTDANLRARANHTGTQAIATVTGLQTALDGKIASTEKGAANGVAPLDAGSKIAAVYLPSFVDDVLEFANLAAFPGTGDGGKIYIALDTNKQWRWSGSAYVEITASPGSTDAVAEGASNLYFTMQRVRDAVLTGLSLASAAAVTAADTVLGAIGKLQKQITDNLATLTGHTGNTGNPHGTTKAQVGLGNADNTSDANKPVSTAQQAALDAKAPINNAVFTGTTTLAQDPASALQAATKQYVDTLLANLGKRTRVRVATTANITISTALNSGDVIDGVTLANGDWVLVKDQSTAAQNGVYAVAASPARVAEYDTYGEHAGSLIAVQEGTVGDNTLWLCVANPGGTLNTTGIAFTRMVIAGELLAANNLSDLANAATARTNLGAQATLVSATNIKTINGGSLLGSGDLVVSGGGGGYSPRTNNTPLGVADKGVLISATGTFTQTFSGVATLGVNWYCYYRNDGTGTITFDPNGSETIDGVTSGIVPPGMALMVVCDGTSLFCVRIGPHVVTEVLTSGTSWLAPLGVRRARIRMIGPGAGGSGAEGYKCGSCGTAGGYLEKTAVIAPGTVTSYSIGAGGLGGGAGGGNGSPGGGTYFYLASGTLIANGGGSTYYASGGVGGDSSGGDINIRGNPATAFLERSSGQTDSSIGGGTVFGSYALATQAGSYSGGNYAATGYGAGGLAGGNGSSGSDGQPGLIVLEY